MQFDFRKPKKDTGAQADLPALPTSWEMVKSHIRDYETLCQNALTELRAVPIGPKTSLEPVIDTAATVKRFMKAIKKVKETKLAPHDMVVKEVNATVRRINDLSTQVANLSKSIMTQVKQAQKIEQERLKRETEERDRKLQEAVNREAKVLGVETVEIPKTPVKEERVTRTETGASGHFRKDWQVEVVNVRTLMLAILDPKDERVDLEYDGQPLITVDESVIKKMAKAGRRDIPGIKVTEIDTPVVRT